MELKELRPQAGEFTLSQTGKTYHIRPLSLDDEIWLMRRFGPEGIGKVFNPPDFESISEICFHQLTGKDREDFVAKTVRLVNEEGEYVEETIAGARLLRTLILGWNEKLEIIKALALSIGVSRELLEPGSPTPAPQKKTLKKPTGRKSSI